MAFGSGENVSRGTKATAFGSDAVVVAAGSDPRGPSARVEGDFVWRIRGGILEMCEWADDGRQDCRLATYEGFAPPDRLVFLPTIIEPGNLASGTSVDLYDQGALAASVSFVASKKTRAVSFEANKSIWITAGVDAIPGAQPVFLCSSGTGDPVCRALPFVVSRVFGTAVLTNGGHTQPVLWVAAASNAAGGGVAVVTDLGIYRCEGRNGLPACVKAREVVQ